jgi:hypothetical protein
MQSRGANRGKAVDAIEGPRVGSGGLELGQRAEKVREKRIGRAPRAFRLSSSEGTPLFKPLE